MRSVIVKRLMYERMVRIVEEKWLEKGCEKVKIRGSGVSEGINEMEKK